MVGRGRSVPHANYEGKQGMLNSAILEVIIGMVFIFAILSILVTQVNGVISNALKLRAFRLRDGIGELIDDPILQAKILTHPLIRLIKDQLVLPEQVISEEDAQKINKSAVNHVSYIPPKTFVNVLMNLIRVDSDKELFGALYRVIDNMPSGPDRRKLRLLVNRITKTGEGLDELRSTIDNLEEEMYRDSLKEALDQIDEEIGDLGLESNSIVSLLAGLRNVKNPYFRTALNTILSTSETLIEAETQLEEWFNEGMSRASAAYARNMQTLSLLVGLLIAVFINVDTIYVASTLWNDPALRATVAEAARTTDLEALQDGTANEQEQAANGADAAGTQAGTSESDEPEEGSVAAVVESAAEAGETLEVLLELRLPLGWNFDDLSEVQANNPASPLLSDSRYLWNLLPWNNPDWWQMLLGKLIGWAATMIAIAQGAPFWFNILNRLTRGNSDSSK